MGRKAKATLGTIRDDWREVINGMMGEGAHKKEVIRELGITQSIHARLMAQEDEYREIFENGELLSFAWWMKQARENLTNKNYNTTLFIFLMKAVHGLYDRPSHEGGQLAINDKTKQLEIVSRYRIEEPEKDVEEAEIVN